MSLIKVGFSDEGDGEFLRSGEFVRKSPQVGREHQRLAGKQIQWQVVAKFAANFLRFQDDANGALDLCHDDQSIELQLVSIVFVLLRE